MQPFVTKPTISESAANKMIEAAIAKARALGVPQVIAVLDESGQLKAFCRMDGAPLVSIEVAQNKAYTALFGVPSAQLFQMIAGDPALLAALPHVPRMTLIGGGLPIHVDGRVCGAVGVGGGSVEQDVACAEAALAALAP